MGGLLVASRGVRGQLSGTSDGASCGQPIVLNTAHVPTCINRRIGRLRFAFLSRQEAKIAGEHLGDGRRIRRWADFSGLEARVPMYAKRWHWAKHSSLSTAVTSLLELFETTH